MKDVLKSVCCTLTVMLVGGLLASAETDFKAKYLAQAETILDRNASKAVRLKAAKDYCHIMEICYGVWSPSFQIRYCQPGVWSEAELAKSEKAYWTGQKLLADESAPNDHHPWQILGRSYLVTGQYEKALEANAKALERLADCTPKSDPKRLKGQAKCLFERANMLWALGRTNEAASVLRDYLARKLPKFTRRGEEPIHWYAQIALQNLEGGDLDRLRMPRHTGAKAFPEPQRASYSDSFVPVAAYDLEVTGLEPNDRRLELLDVKFTRFGAPKKQGAAFRIRIAVDAQTKAFESFKDPAAFTAFREKRFADRHGNKTEKPVDTSPKAFAEYMENEAYALEVTARGAEIVAKTKQGALWGIVSLIQLWDPEKRQIRLAKIVDWPDVEKRGYLGEYWDGTLEFTLFNKMNSVCHQRHPCTQGVFRPINWYLEEFMGRQFHDFGLELFFGNNWMTHAPQLPMCSPKTLPYRIAVCRRYAAAHIGVYYPLDDVRYPICEPDRKTYGDTISQVDGQHQNAIFQAVIKDYPDWRFIVCPPPYFGPEGRYTGPEPRDHYLKTWSRELDPRIEVYWTGTRVKSGRFEPWHNQWALERYGRRPYLFQNGMLGHHGLHYTVDHIGWSRVYCEGTVDKFLKGYHLNSHTPSDTPRIAIVADFLWNVGAYSTRHAAEIGLAQVSGEKMYALLDPAIEDLCYFDKYPYGETDSRVDKENRAALERRSLNVETCWSNATEYAESVGAPIYGAFGRGVGWMRDVMRRVRNGPPPPHGKPKPKGRPPRAPKKAPKK